MPIQTKHLEPMAISAVLTVAALRPCSCTFTYRAVMHVCALELPPVVLHVERVPSCTSGEPREPLLPMLLARIVRDHFPLLRSSMIQHHAPESAQYCTACTAALDEHVRYWVRNSVPPQLRRIGVNKLAHCCSAAPPFAPAPASLHPFPPPPAHKLPIPLHQP